MTATAETLQSVIEGIVAETVERLSAYNFLPLLGQYMVDLQELHWQYFESASDPSGNPWAPLSPSTIEAKGHEEILIDTERLIESLAMQGDDSVRILEKQGDRYQLVFGTSVEYAIHHMTGTSKMPARPMVGISTAVVGVWVDEIAANAVAALKGA